MYNTLVASSGKADIFGLAAGTRLYRLTDNNPDFSSLVWNSCAISRNFLSFSNIDNNGELRTTAQSFMERLQIASEALIAGHH